MFTVEEYSIAVPIYPSSDSTEAIEEVPIETALSLGLTFTEAVFPMVSEEIRKQIHELIDGWAKTLNDEDFIAALEQLEADAQCAREAREEELDDDEDEDWAAHVAYVNSH